MAWDDPCHLCHAQGIRTQPREVLARIDGLETTPLEGSESCCGSAGIYSVLRPGTSREVFEPRRAALERSGASVQATANPGCQLQWEAGLRRAGLEVRVVHLAELVEAAGGTGPIVERARLNLKAGELERAQLLIEVARASAPRDPAVISTEIEILEALLARARATTNTFSEVAWRQSEMGVRPPPAAPSSRSSGQQRAHSCLPLSAGIPFIADERVPNHGNKVH